MAPNVLALNQRDFFRKDLEGPDGVRGAFLRLLGRSQLAL